MSHSGILSSCCINHLIQLMVLLIDIVDEKWHSTADEPSTLLILTKNVLGLFIEEVFPGTAGHWIHWKWYMATATP